MVVYPYCHYIKLSKVVILTWRVAIINVTSKNFKQLERTSTFVKDGDLHPVALPIVISRDVAQKLAVTASAAPVA